MHFIPGQGQKKPLNMLEAPIYPDIKQAPPEFKWSKKHWEVDVGNTLMGLEANTHLFEDAVLARSYRENIDRYGQSSHQEKITVFRPPLQNTYEDFEPLNRLPVKIHAIEARINPGTSTDSGGTVAFQVNNNQQQEVSRFITDRIDKATWRNTYYLPIDMGPDTSVLPDLETKLPSSSLYAGYSTPITFNAPSRQSELELEDVRPRLSMHSGVECDYRQPLYHQAPEVENFEFINPQVSAHSGFQNQYTQDGDTHLSELQLNKTLPNRSVSSGIKHEYMMDGDTKLDDIELYKNIPTYATTSGFNPITTFDGKTRFEDIQLNSILHPAQSVINPGSEDGYKTDVGINGSGFTDALDHIKIKENPKVPVSSHKTFNYVQADNIQSDKPFFRTKMEPSKSYNTPLNTGTIRRSGVEVQTVNKKYLRNGGKQIPIY